MFFKVSGLLEGTVLRVAIPYLHSGKVSNKLANRTAMPEARWWPGSTDGPENHGVDNKLLH